MATYYSKHAGEGPWDTIVVGSGMGGMVAANMLARVGHRVLVLEQHYVPGGMTHTFKRKKWRWDVGVHAIGEVTGKSLSGRLLKKLTGGKLEWSSLGKVYEQFYFPEGYRIDFPDDREQFRDNLVAAFPDEVAAIDGYFAEVRKVSREMRGFFIGRVLPRWAEPILGPFTSKKAEQHFQRRTSDVVNALTDNKKLRTVLTSQWGYYGSPPSRSAFGIHALVVKHFWWGAYYPKGGSAKIADTLLQPVADSGGAVRIRAGVESILVEGKKAVGVRLEDGEEIRAKRVISAVGAKATAERLLPRGVGNMAPQVEDLGQSPCHICLYIGFKGDIGAVGASGANKWFYETWDHEVLDWDFRNEESLAPILYCSFPSMKDPDHDPGPDQLHTGEVVTFLPWDAFAEFDGTQWKKRPEDYDKLKKDLSERLLKQYLKHMPELEPMVAFTELSTPVSTTHFCRSPQGAIYGLEPTPARFANPALRPKTAVPGLYMAGCDVGMCGVMGAAVGGALAALAAEPRKTFGLLKSIAS